eukprot:11419451-Alexandrium_andersonii.AAC.1
MCTASHEESETEVRHVRSQHSRESWNAREGTAHTMQLRSIDSVQARSLAMSGRLWGAEFELRATPECIITSACMRSRSHARVNTPSIDTCTPDRLHVYELHHHAACCTGSPGERLQFKTPETQRHRNHNCRPTALTGHAQRHVVLC